MPGASLIQTAATDQRPLTSDVSPRIGIPSGVSESRPLMACRMPTVSSPRTSGTSSSACSIWSSKSSWVNGSSVGDSADAAIEGMSSASIRIGRCAYEPTSRSPPCWRSYMLVSMSRTIGNVISPTVPANCGTGPTLIIWWTAGVSGMWAPAIFAIRGLQQPHAMTTVSAAIVPLSVWTARTWPSWTSMPVTSVPAEIVRAPSSCARSRMIVPARSESTTPTSGVEKPPRMTESSRYGTCSLIWAGVSSSVSMPHEIDDVVRRFSSSIRSGVRATSMPPLRVKTPISLYWTTLSRVSAVISFEWSVRKMKFEA